MSNQSGHLPPHNQGFDETVVIPRQRHGGLTGRMVAAAVGGVFVLGLAAGGGWALATGGGGGPAAAVAPSSTSPAPATTAATTAVAAATTSATTAAPVAVSIVGYGSGLCVTVPGDVGTSALTLQQCGSGGTQLFTLGTVSAGYTLTGRSSGACADVGGTLTSDGVPIVQQSCAGSASQTWSLQPQAGGDGQEYRLVDIASGMCLDAYGAATTAGTTLDQWPCKSNPFQDDNQVWRLVRQ